MYATSALPFVKRVCAAFYAENPGTTTRLGKVGEFKTAGEYRRFLDAAEAIVLPIVECCERETLAEEGGGGAAQGHAVR